MSGSFEIGRFYKVPTVRGRLYHIERDWPVIGPKHEDGKHISFPYQHFHIDWRFVSVRDYRRVCGRAVVAVAGIVLLEGNGRPNAVLPSPVIRYRKCVREIEPFPGAPWLAELQAAFADHKLKDMICPHRGLPLAGCPQTDDVVTCPGHGLKWNVRTGELVRRVEL